METSASASQAQSNGSATQGTPKKATVSMGDKSVTIEGRAAALVNGVAFVAAAVLATLFIVRALQQEPHQHQ